VGVGVCRTVAGWGCSRASGHMPWRPESPPRITPDPALACTVCRHSHRLLRQHLSELGPCAEQSLQELGLYKPDMASEVVTLQVSDRRGAHTQGVVWE
jgi:hypothetical protein